MNFNELILRKKELIFCKNKLSTCIWGKSVENLRSYVFKICEQMKHIKKSVVALLNC
jgi:hypothetical protein